MQYSEETIRRVSRAAGPENLLPAPPEALEQGRQIANAYFDTYNTEDWRRLLNRIHPAQAAGVISNRPFEDQKGLLILIGEDRRPEVERHLAALAA